jgi:hypothetical protein
VGNDSTLRIDCGWSGHRRYVLHQEAFSRGYSISPSIVWQNEFDLEVPRHGGEFVAGDGTATPVGNRSLSISRRASRELELGDPEVLKKR